MEDEIEFVMTNKVEGTMDAEAVGVVLHMWVWLLFLHAFCVTGGRPY